MGVLRIKDGVSLCDPTDYPQALVAPAGFRLLGSIDRVLRTKPYDLWLTSGTDGTHSGPADPHKLGEAYDLGNHAVSLDEHRLFVHALIRDLMEADDTLFVTSGGWATNHFFAFVEDPGTPNQHIHCQRRKGTVYP